MMRHVNLPAVALALGLLGAAVPKIARADEPASDSSAKQKEEEARTHFAAGVNLVRDPARPRYDEAYAEFKQAYSLVASPKILGNLGLCAMKLERDGEAIDAYTRYLKEAPDVTPEEREQAERDLTTLKATLATVTIETTPPGGTIVDARMPNQGEPIRNVYGPIAAKTQLGVRRGHHVMRVRFDNGREATWEADIAGGESHVFEMPADVAEPVRGPDVTTTSRPIPTSVYVAGGLTVALGIGSLVTGLVAVNKHSDFEETNNGTDPTAAEDLRSSGQTLNTVSDILLIGTIVGAGVTTFLFLTRPVSHRNEPKMGFKSPLQLHF
jgi:hypothetical protein